MQQVAANLNETKVSNLFTALKKYFNDEEDWQDELNTLSSDFQFMETYTLDYLSTELAKVTSNRTTSSAVETAINNFLSEMWEEIGRTPLKYLYYEPYKKVQITNMEAGWSQKDNENYGYYYPVVLFLNSIEAAIAERDKIISDYEKQYSDIQQENLNISNELLMSNNFTEGQLIRLNAFLREDELQLDDIVATDQDSIADSFKVKQDAMESGRIELNKLCQPQLQFSMSMANIYALPEFEPIIDQFQLGKVIKVGLRPDYIKQSRLLQVDINFDNFSDFSVEFGELTNLRTQSDIHADLLSQAISAGKSVAQNSSYWTRGSDQTNKIREQINAGLLDAITSIKSIDATQGVEIDTYGIHLTSKNPDTGEIDPKQGWITNNKFLYSDDAFKSTKSVFGEFYYKDTRYYGVIAEALVGGLVSGALIEGGEIMIGEQDDGTYAFRVWPDGSVTMSGGSSIAGYPTEEYVNNKIKEIQAQVGDINAAKMYRVEITTEDPTVISTTTDQATMICRVYSWDTDITNTLDASIFNWKRSSSDSASDEIWNAMPEHQGIKSITIDATDVFENSSFICEVDLPE